MIKRLKLQRYKGFESFHVSFGRNSILVGPNNAGKSTIISALRLCAAAVGHARRRNATEVFSDSERSVTGFRLNALAKRDSAGFVAENVQHEFRDEVSRLELEFSSKAKLFIVWPRRDEGSPFFFLEKLPGIISRTAAAAKEATNSIGIVPTVVPIDQREQARSEDYIRENQLSRLTSRHFRSQLYFLKQQDPGAFDKFVSFIEDNTPELSDLHLETDYVGGGIDLDLYFRESGSATEREIYWAGDGIQIWFQVLFHLFRQATSEVVVLDEPDVFLHPDLQRRLVAILEDTDQQTITATHSPEILAEASRESIVWVDRIKKNSRRVRDDRILSEVNAQLGSGFNLGIARALRSKVALFVEGDDLKLLRNLARTLGCRKLPTEKGVAVIPLKGFTNWHHVQPFAWMTRDLLGEAIEIFVVLDRDYRTDEQVQDVLDALSEAKVHPHVWKKKELESYLLVESALARLSGATEAAIREFIDEIAEDLRAEVFGNLLAERQVLAGKRATGTVSKAALIEFEAMWKDRDRRVASIPPKEVLSRLNQRLADEGLSTPSDRGLSSGLRKNEIAAEMADLLLGVEASL